MRAVAAVHGKRDGKANRRPFCSRVMKERQIVMKERAIPGTCNCCPRGPRIQYYSMGLAIMAMGMTQFTRFETVAMAIT